ncbi:MAG: flagellar M-ring protein FliF C-terminal domain-containing protein, partial [Pirellulaceae bacterium]
MDFLNRAASELGDIFKSMTPGSRITAGLLLAVIVISLVYLLVFSSSRADRYLFGSREFSDPDIAAMQRAFGAENLDEYELEGKRIKVPGNKRTRYMQALDKAGFSPADIEADIDAIRERGSSMFESEEEKEFWRSQAQQRKLGRVISKRPEVDGATVQYREVKKRGFPPETERRATVVVWGRNNRRLDRDVSRTIRKTASAWFGIQPEDVAVTDVNGDVLPVGEGGEGLSKEARMYADAKSFYEEYYRNKLQQALPYLGEGLVVAVNVEMDPTISSQSSKVTVDPQTVAVESEMFTKTSQSGAGDGGRPGSVPNEVRGNEPRALTTATSPKSSSDEESEQQVSITGHEQTEQQRAGLVPKTLTAAVSIPKSYFNKVWRERNPVAEGEQPVMPTDDDLNEIQNEIVPRIEDIAVQSLPLLDPGEDQYDQVEVMTYDDLPAEPVEPPALTSTLMLWFTNHWETLGLFGVGLISLFVLRGMVRAAIPSKSPDTPGLSSEFSSTEDQANEG